MTAKPTWIAEERWPWAFLAYPIAGAAIGFLPLPELTAKLGWSTSDSDTLTALIVLPTAMIAITAAYPRAWTAISGGLLLVTGFVLGGGIAFRSAIRTSPPLSFPWALPRVIVALTIGYIVLALLAMACIRPFRRVGRFEPRPHCNACGYIMEGLSGDRCPECGGERTLTHSGTRP